MLFGRYESETQIFVHFEPTPRGPSMYLFCRLPCHWYSSIVPSMPPMSQDTCHFSGFTACPYIRLHLSPYKVNDHVIAHWNDSPLADRKKGKRNGQAFYRGGKMNVERCKLMGYYIYIMPPDCQQFKFQRPYMTFYWDTATLIHLHIVYG